MARFSGLQALTANHLLTGAVVYWAGEAGWVEDIEAAELYREQETAETAQADAVSRAAKDNVVDPYLFDLTEDGGTLRPTAQREIIRVSGPTVQVDLNTAPLGEGAR